MICGDCKINIDNKPFSAEQLCPECEDCGSQLKSGVNTTDKNSKWCDSCYYFD